MVKTLLLSQPQTCPCGALDKKGRVVAFQLCCGRFLDAGLLPSLDFGAVQLMRSRYSAFVLSRFAYVLGTWHGSTRPDSLDDDPHVRWLGLDVRAHQQVLDADPPAAMVRFVARYRDKGGRAVRMHEQSRFVYEGGRWWYVDGQLLD